MPEERPHRVKREHSSQPTPAGWRNGSLLVMEADAKRENRATDETAMQPPDGPGPLATRVDLNPLSCREERL
jgi:hypothetical protein